MEKAETESSERRKFIYRQIARFGSVSYKEICQHFEKEIRPHLLKQDVEFWRSLGFDLSVIRSSLDSREKIIVEGQSRQVAAKAVRSQINRQEKEIVAQAAMGLLCGFDSWAKIQSASEETIVAIHARQNQQANYIPREFIHCYTRNELIAELTRPRASHTAESTAHSVVNRMVQFHHEMSRLISMDAGTTMDILASYISKLKLPTAETDHPVPTPGTNLAFLTVCTNSRGIFQILGEPEVNTRVIIIGGEQRGRSEAVAGRLSELFLQTAGLLRFGVSLLGATFIDADKSMQCCSESQVLSRLKAIIFGQSALRVVCADHSKLLSRPMWSAYPFVSITPQQVDMILTNYPPIPDDYREMTSSKKESLLESWRNFHDAVEKIEKHGVPVFCARPSSTIWPFGKPSEASKKHKRPQTAQEAAQTHSQWEAAVLKA